VSRREVQVLNDLRLTEVTRCSISLHPLVLDVVNSYLGLWSKLIYFDMWHTL